MPLHEPVGITKRAQLKYMGYGVYVDDCVCVLSDLA